MTELPANDIIDRRLEEIFTGSFRNADDVEMMRVPEEKMKWKYLQILPLAMCLIVILLSLVYLHH